jgi:phosphate transport system protein
MSEIQKGLMQQNEHTFTKFDDDLNSIRAHILEMCELVEMQLGQALLALFNANSAIAREVVDQDYSVNKLEELIDSLCITAIARQQPAASDLRSIVISTKIVMELERIGDEAKKIARIANRLAQHRHMTKQRFSSVHLSAQLAQKKLAEAIGSFARLDTFTAYRLLDSEELINEQFNITFREMVQSMTTDPRTISSSLEIIFVSKAIERIGIHTKHICRLVIDMSNRYNQV